MFFYKPKFYTLDLRKDKALNMFLVGNQREYTPKLIILYTVFLYSVKLGYKLRKKTNKEPLVVEQNNTSKILNARIVYDLNSFY